MTGDRLASVTERHSHSASQQKTTNDLGSSTLPSLSISPLLNSPRHEKVDRRWTVGAILASSFLSLLGFTMTGPITPALGRYFELEAGASFGSLTSAYPMGMFVGVFIWPALSDRIGRKPVIALSLFGSGLGLTLQSLVIRSDGSLSLFLAMRMLTGLFAGNSPVSKALLADLGFQDGNLPKYLALKDASATAAYVIGPAAGGIMYDLIHRHRTGNAEDMLSSDSLSIVIGVSAAASIVASMAVMLFVKESYAKERWNKKIRNDDTNQDSTPFSLIAATLMGAPSIFIVSFLFNIGDATFHAFFAQLLKHDGHFDAKSIGLVYTFMACISFLMSATSVGSILKNHGPVATCAAGLFIVSTGLLGIGASAFGSSASFAWRWIVAFASLFCSGVSLYGPSIPAMLFQHVEANQRGKILGLDGAINTIGRVIGPILLGGVSSRLGSAAAFASAGLVVLCGSFALRLSHPRVSLKP
ncbi:unnamed protein product [Cylindrotheca closterium]|uniref:Major facilitator superfamily (MFS) profile domain-containing protein n=1 Tax=Cylindrotheca closterium TaxID=2856 RepID=A0AAD2G4X7_9STRA|nr:unnamed protein product [Cylindrotheca closterium]